MTNIISHILSKNPDHKVKATIVSPKLFMSDYERGYLEGYRMASECYERIVREQYERMQAPRYYGQYAAQQDPMLLQAMAGKRNVYYEGVDSLWEELFGK